uniref:Uncharacterized protein n=1 Tax=Cannabis sativa TaxID=3483 RepID=A0A803Q6U1_CANSA
MPINSLSFSLPQCEGSWSTVMVFHGGQSFVVAILVADNDSLSKVVRWLSVGVHLVREEFSPIVALPPTGGSLEETLPCWMHCLLEPSGMVPKVASDHIVKEKYLKDGKFSINMDE